MAKLCSAAMNNPKFRRIVATQSHTAKLYRNEKVIEITWHNTNKLLSRVPVHCKGLKTGVTPQAGPSLATFWEVNGKEYIIVVNKCLTFEHRFNDSLALFEALSTFLRMNQ